MLVRLFILEKHFVSFFEKKNTFLSGMGRHEVVIWQKNKWSKRSKIKICCFIVRYHQWVFKFYFNLNCFSKSLFFFSKFDREKHHRSASSRNALRKYFRDFNSHCCKFNGRKKNRRDDDSQTAITTRLPFGGCLVISERDAHENREWNSSMHEFRMIARDEFKWV